MKIMHKVVVFFSLIQMITVIGMDKNKQGIMPPFSVTTKKINYRTFDHLVCNKAALLKRLVAQERLMYCRQSERAQEVLADTLLKKFNDQDVDWVAQCDPETVNFISLIARKKDDCTRLVEAMDKHEPLAVENLLHSNPHVANHYFIAHPYEGKITPLHYIVSKIAENKHYEHYMNPLLRAGANPNALDEGKNTLMHKVLTTAQVDLLWRYGACSDEINIWGQTPLMSAIARKCSDVACYLNAAGVDLTVQDNYGNTPLHLAVFHLDDLVMKDLLARNASFETVNIDNRSPAYFACKNPLLKKTMKPYIPIKLWHALRNGDEFVIRELISNHPWMDYMLQGSPLMTWVKEQCSDTTVNFFEKMLTKTLHQVMWFSTKDAERLILAGAQINSKSDYALYPLQFALDRQELDHKENDNLILLLLKYGALVTQSMIQNAQGEIRIWLQTAHDDQSCCVCYGHFDDMTDMFCQNRHHNSFICKKCYEKVKESNNKVCPISRCKLTEYGT